MSTSSELFDEHDFLENGNTQEETFLPVVEQQQPEYDVPPLMNLPPGLEDFGTPALIEPITDEEEEEAYDVRPSLSDPTLYQHQTPYILPELLSPQQPSFTSPSRTRSRPPVSAQHTRTFNPIIGRRRSRPPQQHPSPFHRQYNVPPTNTIPLLPNQSFVSSPSSSTQIPLTKQNKLSSAEKSYMNPPPIVDSNDMEAEFPDFSKLPVRSHFRKNEKPKEDTATPEELENFDFTFEIPVSSKPSAEKLSDISTVPPSSLANPEDFTMTIRGKNWKKTITSQDIYKHGAIVEPKRSKRRKFKNPQSNFIGVSWCNQTDRWKVVVQGKHVTTGRKMNRTIGVFPVPYEVQAAYIYDMALIKSGKHPKNFKSRAHYLKTLKTYARKMPKKYQDQKVAQIQSWGKRIFTDKEFKSVFKKSECKVRYSRVR